jgi:hypothetical protein
LGVPPAARLTGLTLSQSGAQNQLLNSGDSVWVTLQFNQTVVVNSSPVVMLQVGHPSSTANPDFSRFRLSDLNKIKHLQLMS